MAKRSIDIAAVLSGQVSKLDTTDNVQLVPLSYITVNPDNFYDTSEALGDLCDSIETHGVIEPLVVLKRSDDNYRIISGHRRYRAMMVLQEKFDSKFDKLPCIVITRELSAAEEMSLLIESNRQRVKTSYERGQEVERLTNAYIEMKEAGAKLPGRIRDRVAEALEISAAKAGRLTAIQKNLVNPELQRRYKSNIITESVAYEVAQLSPKEQDKLVDYCTGKDTPVTLPMVKRFKTIQVFQQTLSIPEKKSLWHSEDPVASGFYWCITGPLKQGGRLLFWDGHWQHPCMMINLEINVLCWIPCPALPEEYTWNREGLNEETT